MTSRQPKTGTRGRITRTHTVWCGDCQRSYRAAENASLAVAEFEWMSLGWCRFAVVGWLCPDCSAAHHRDIRRENGLETEESERSDDAERD